MTQLVSNEIPAIPPDQRIHFECGRCGRQYGDLRGMVLCYEGHRKLGVQPGLSGGISAQGTELFPSS